MATDQVKLDKYSMFRRTPVRRVNEEVVFSLRRDVIVPDSTDRIIEVLQTHEGKLDLISYELYGNNDLWWAIAELNGIIDPIAETKKGRQLRVPQRERLLNLLSS